jgi:hypothetical protein
MNLSNNQQNGPQVTEAATSDRISEPVSGAAPAAPKDDAGAAGTAASNASNVERAEQITYKVAETAAHAASTCVRGVAWLFASTKEAVEDVWAEAQSIRRGEKNE